MPLTFQELPGGPAGRPFVSIDQTAVDALEAVTPAEKAQAVPVVRIWEIDPETGLPRHGRDGRPTRPINLRLAEPPRFGAAVGSARFRERPPVSLERVSFATRHGLGIVTYNQLELSFVVHRPEVVFAELDPDADNWSTLITPGTVHALEYGWSASTGVKNGILNGEGIDNLAARGSVGELGEKPFLIPAVKRVRFVVADYSLRITADGQIRVLVKAWEDGEHNLRRALVGGGQPGLEKVDRHGPAVPVDPYAGGQADLKALRERLRRKFGESGARGKKGVDKLVGLAELADELFAPAIEESYRSLGYDVRLYMGRFNERAGRLAPDRGGTNASGAWIGDFKLRLSEVEKIFADVLRDSRQLTLYNFVTTFLRRANDPSSWDRSSAARGGAGEQDAMVPEVTMRTVVNDARDGRARALVVVFDLKREFSRFAENGPKLRPGATREAVRGALKDKGIPVVSFLRGNSFIEDAEFEVMHDDPLVLSAFVQRYLRPTRRDLIEAAARLKRETGVDPRELIYSGALSGTVTMLGNFVFDNFALVWFDFGVPRWDGLFTLVERQDVVEPGSFVTRLTVKSMGTDALGTQGRAVAQDLARLAAGGGT